MRLLIAGLTGQLGQGIVEGAADVGVELVPLVRPTPRSTASERIARVFGRGSLAEQTVAGDVTRERWGLDEAMLTRLAVDVDGVINLAGEVDWTARDRVLWETNVLGAATGLACARALYSRSGRCRLYCLAGSVHVAGGLAGRVAEVRHGPDARRTRYEHSKWQGEELVLEANGVGGPRVLVARVGGLVGSSTTGATAQRGSLYLLDDGLKNLPAGFLPVFGRGRVDMLPRDVAGQLLLRTAVSALEADGPIPEIVHVCAGEAAPRTDAVIAAAQSLDAHRRLRTLRRVPVPVPVQMTTWVSENAERFSALSRKRGSSLAGLRYLAVDRVFERDRLAQLVGPDLPAPSLELLVRLVFGVAAARPNSVGAEGLARFAG